MYICNIMTISDVYTRSCSDCASLTSELDSTREKLDSNMNSIRTFWSPELKKERAVRKEESARHAVYRDQQAGLQAQMVSGRGQVTKGCGLAIMGRV